MKLLFKKIEVMKDKKKNEVKNWIKITVTFTYPLKPTTDGEELQKEGCIWTEEETVKRRKEGRSSGLWNRKNRDKIVIDLLMYSIPLHTPQFGRNEKLKKWVVLDGMGSITFHSIHFLQNQTMEPDCILHHSIPFHHFPSIQTQPKYLFYATYIPSKPIQYNTIPFRAPDSLSFPSPLTNPWWEQRWSNFVLLGFRNLSIPWMLSMIPLHIINCTSLSVYVIRSYLIFFSWKFWIMSRFWNFFVFFCVLIKLIVWISFLFGSSGCDHDTFCWFIKVEIDCVRNTV